MCGAHFGQGISEICGCMLQTLINERVWGRPVGALQILAYCATAHAIAKKILCSSIILDADTQHATRSERTPECGRGLRVCNMPGPTYMYWCCTAPAAPAPGPISRCQRGFAAEKRALKSRR
jgi:hypothetical protein